MKNEPTKSEHYIAQVHLKGFSPEYVKYKQNKKTKCFIYYYDLINNIQQKAVPVDSVCAEKNLYEFRNDDGNIIYQNLIENTLSAIEKVFPKYREKLEKKAFFDENYKTKCFLTSEEKAFWVTYIVVQMLRSPKVLDEAEKIARDTFADQISSQEAKNLSRYFCIPFLKNIEDNSPEAEFIGRLSAPMLNMYFSICVDKKGRFITSDKAMYIYSPEFPCDEFERVVFPITSELCLILIGRELKKQCTKKNFLFPANEEAVERVFADMSRSAYEKIYANRELNPKEVKLLKHALNTKYSKD